MQIQANDSIREMETFDRLPPDMQRALQQAPRGVPRSFVLNLLAASRSRATHDLLAAYDARFPGYEPLLPDLPRWREVVAGAGFEPATCEV